MTTRDELGPDGIAGRLQDAAELAVVSLALWQDDSDKAAARRAGSAAVNALDHMTTLIYTLRAQLIDELRRADDQANKDADETLARIRAQRAAMAETGDMLDQLRQG